MFKYMSNLFNYIDNIIGRMVYAKQSIYDKYGRINNRRSCKQKYVHLFGQRFEKNMCCVSSIFVMYAIYILIFLTMLFVHMSNTSIIPRNGCKFSNFIDMNDKMQIDFIRQTNFRTDYNINMSNDVQNSEHVSQFTMPYRNIPFVSTDGTIKYNGNYAGKIVTHWSFGKILKKYDVEVFDCDDSFKFGIKTHLKPTSGVAGNGNSQQNWQLIDFTMYNSNNDAKYYVKNNFTTNYFDVYELFRRNVTNNTFSDQTSNTLLYIASILINNTNSGIIVQTFYDSDMFENKLDSFTAYIVSIMVSYNTLRNRYGDPSYVTAMNVMAVFAGASTCALAIILCPFMCIMKIIKCRSKKQKRDSNQTYCDSNGMSSGIEMSEIPIPLESILLAEPRSHRIVNAIEQQQQQNVPYDDENRFMDQSGYFLDDPMSNQKYVIHSDTQSLIQNQPSNTNSASDASSEQELIIRNTYELP